MSGIVTNLDPTHAHVACCNDLCNTTSLCMAGMHVCAVPLADSRLLLLALLLLLRWNPTTEEQAIDRAHRIGQTRTVHVRLSTLYLFLVLTCAYRLLL
jgi:hypothetical protein